MRWSRQLAGVAVVAVLVAAPAPANAEEAPRNASVIVPERGDQRLVSFRRMPWSFAAAAPALSTLTAQAPQAEFAAPDKAGESFTVRFTVDFGKVEGNKVILEVPDVFSVRLRRHDPRDRNRQNYPAFRLPDGTVNVLEANVVLHSEERPAWKNMTIGFPLGMLAEPAGVHDIVLHCAGADWQMFVDGELVDGDFPFGHPRWAPTNAWKLDPAHVSKAALHVPALEPRRRGAEPLGTAATIQYWTPRGHNDWVGDVATLFHAGRYHVFYLFDRRHHQSKFGCGAHYFEHISTQDFKTWTEHEAATPLEEQWECIGTGTPFVFDGRLCVSYGLHTTRVYPQEKTTLPAQWEHLKKNGRTGAFGRDTAPGFPAGSTYSVSADGVSKFAKSHVTFHPCENPSVFTAPGGGLRMMANYRANGIWESGTVDGGWRCINPGFPPGGDCTFFFRWGAFDYIIGGFKNLWMKPIDAPNSAYQDVVRQGLDFYDGSNVPAISEIAGGRFLMAAWIPVRGWGGNLVIRELVQFPDGRIGSKWMRELTPKTQEPRTLAERLAETATFPVDGDASLLTFEVRPGPDGKGRVGLSFLPENGEQAACELQILPEQARAQYGPGSATTFAAPEKSLREGGAPQSARNYAIEHLIDVDKPFTVRVITRNDDKIGGSLIDAEIAGQRTMISYRPDLTVRKLVFRADGAEVRDIRVAPLEH